MKTQLRKMQLLMKIFDANDFYAIRLNEKNIALQGEYSRDVAKKYEKICKSRFVKSDKGYWDMIKNNINITLT